MFGVREMKFDVVIGNPPYQLNDGGGLGTSASPIYNKFIEQAQKLDPRHLVMVIPSKWYSGGKGLDGFRSRMLSDRRIRYIADFPDSREAFSGVDVAGGVCYFLWNRDDEGLCKVETFEKGKTFSAERKLDEFETFVRDNRALEIVHKVIAKKEIKFSSIVSSRKPFGIESAQTSDPQGDCYLFSSGKDGKIKRKNVPKGHDLIDTWRVLLSKTSSEHAGQTDKSGRKRLFSRIEIMPPGSVCSESYLVIGPFKNKIQAGRAVTYLQSRFVRFLVSTILLTQNISKSMFDFVPTQDFTNLWTDEELYAKYGMTKEEIAYIESSIRSLDPNDE
jgi:site-specific DNA-methyltransferase (adenine-specific)